MLLHTKKLDVFLSLNILNGLTVFQFSKLLFKHYLSNKEVL